MSGTDVALVREMYTRWEAGDFATPEYFQPNVVLTRYSGHGEGVGVSGEWHGIEGLWKGTLEWIEAFDKVTIESDDFVDLGDRVLVLDRQVARGRDSGIPVTHELGHIFTMRDGKIARWDGYWDRSEALQAAGLEPEP